MSQHNFNIADNACATVRGEINSAFQALASLSSGTSAPTTPYPYQVWIDTSPLPGNNADVKMRNGNNDGWVKFAEIAANNQMVFLAANNNEYMGEGHITIIPEFYHSADQGTWTIGMNASYAYGHYLYNSTNALNDAITWKVFLNSGTYKIKALAQIGPDMALGRFYIDGNEVVAVDYYDANTEINDLTRTAASNFNVTTPGLKSIQLKVTSKTGTDYYLCIQRLAFCRIA